MEAGCVSCGILIYMIFSKEKMTVLGSIATISYLAGGPAARGPLGQWQGDGVGPGPTGRGLKAVLDCDGKPTKRKC